MSKPEPIVLGMGGIDANRMMGDTDEPEAGSKKINIDIHKLASRPPFQLYLREIGLTASDGKCEQEFALQYLSRQASKNELGATFQGYEEWFVAKGKWPNENPMGA